MMLRLLSAAAPVLALVTAPLAAAPAPAAPGAAPLQADADLQIDLHCAAAFALAAAAQARGSTDALALPPMAVRGKRFFADVGARAVEQGGMTQEAVRDLLVDEVAAMQRRTASAPDGALAAEVRPCLARLDAAVPDVKSGY